MITPEDDSFHLASAGSESPYWQETSWFSVLIPERGIAGWVYFYHRPNMRLTAGGAAFWDGDGEEVYDCLFYEWDHHQALPDDADMFSFSLRGGRSLTVSLREPLRCYDLHYNGDGCEVDLRWEAFTDPIETRHPEPDFAKRLAAHGDPTKVNPAMSSWAPSYYQHLGRVRGLVTIRGEQIPVDSFSIHDRSWGPRQADERPPFLRGRMLYAVASEDSFFALMANSHLPLDEDPIHGTEESVSYGFYGKDGLVGQLLSGQTCVAERGPDGRPLRVLVEAEDEHGRQLRAVGRSRVLLKWSAFTTLFSLWCLAEWELDGATTYGEIQDYMHVSQYRRVARATRVGG